MTSVTATQTGTSTTFDDADLPANTFPGTEQYGRKLSLIVSTASGAGIDLSQLRVRFTVKRGDFQTPNTADIRVYNLSKAKAHQLRGEEYSQLVLQAGYAGNFGIIFAGTITQSREGRESQTDSYVDFTAGDGDEIYNYSTVIASMPAGNNSPDLQVQKFLASMQEAAAVTPGNTIPVLDNKDVVFQANASARGKVLYGPVRKELREFCMTNDMQWSIQDGRLVMIPRSSYLKDSVQVISPDTGLIGIPEQTQNGIQLKVLLNPSIKIGSAIRLDSTINQLRLSLDQASQSQNEGLLRTIKESGDGLYYVMIAEHSGDTRANTWHTDITCLAVDASLPVSSTIYVDSYFVRPGPVPRYP